MKNILLTTLPVLALGITSTQAEITYVDADATNTTFAPLAAGETPWELRTVDDVNGPTVYQANNTEDSPEGTTTLTIPDGNYNLYVYFWDKPSTTTPAESWNLAAGLTSGSLTSYGDKYTIVPLAVAADFAAPTPVLNKPPDNRDLYQIDLGPVAVTGGSVDIFFDHVTNPTNRSFYDGVGYELVTPPPAIIDLADATLTGVDTVVRDEFADIAGEDSIYIAGTMTFNAVDASNSVVLTEVQIDGTTEAYRIGQLNNTNDFANIKPTVSVLDDTLTVGESHRVVIKMDTLTGDFSVWLDPDLGLPEASNVADVTGNNPNGIGALEQVQFRTNGDADADFTGFALYTGATTPFGAVSEPFAISITPNASNPGNYDFEWDSQEGKLYKLVSDTVLGTTAPADWLVWDGRDNIPSDPGTSTSLINVPGGSDPTRFFAVVEKE